MKINWFAVFLIILQIGAGIYCYVTKDLKMFKLTVLYAMANYVMYFQ